MEDLIGYDEIIERSMRLVIFKALKKIEKGGLPGKHYFIITFLTKFPQVSISKTLKEKYNEEMTIAVQYQFRGLKVEDDHFEISLSFGGKYEKLSVPYNAVTSFSDPSINFALKFSLSYENGNEQDDNITILEGAEDKAEVDVSAKVVSLDAFRKNNPNSTDK